ncbi:C6 finger domain-containing protein [Colletotrichum higginsianum IMI 349063]|uniref:C6 finger domain-containing protein n=2 Tax=Colletotrichum higginsianum TaxID=80884 RepID=A0A1B7YNL0_COLHI|nr:C6 finger domain-containing protein [Colletotrichum higginsianum IMI 349063]OBR13468.1 C6 finger domain-containing protein [Colletotrichum higginsianum IMI 349063]
MTSTCADEPRERRTMRRSRFGCRNCKLRKLKCDQGKPGCKRCVSFGVMCNFLSTNVPDLQPIVADTGGPLEVEVRGRTGIRPPLSNAVWTSDATASFQLNAKCQDFITRYLGRSLLSPDDPSMAQVNRRLLELAFTYPYLMHASLAVAFTYDRYLNGPSSCRRTQEECFHWSQSTVLFNRRLRQPVEASDKDRDPIWGTAAALALLSFSSPDASAPEQAWPMRPSGASDIEWLRMSKGKMSLWHTVDPLRPDSLFCVMAATYAHMHAPLPEEGVGGVPAALAAVCGLTDASSAAEGNPYFHAAHAVSRILDLPDREVTTGHTQLFMQTIRGAFKDLLVGRDPAALLLFYLWYRATSRAIWWIDLRARVECSSICLYLRLYHGDNGAIQAFLPGGAMAERWDQASL